VKAERLRAAQDPAALERRVALAAEEGETLRAEFRVLQGQLFALIERVGAAATVDQDLGHQVARLAAQQERLAADPRQLLEAAIQQLGEELDRRWAGLQSQSHQIISGLSLRLEEVQGCIVPSVESIRRELAELQRRADEQQRTQQTERQTLTATIGSLRETLVHDQQSVDEQRREQRRLVEELAAVRAAQHDGVRQAQQLAALGESFESASARWENVEALRRADADRLQAEVDRLRVALAEADAVSAAVNAAKVDSLRADLDALREQLTASDHGARRLPEQPEEPFTEQPPDLSSLSAQAMDVVQESVDSLQVAQRGLMERLAVIESLQSGSDRRLHDMLGTLELLLTGQTRAAGEIGTLSVRAAALAEGQSRQQQLAESLQRAQAIAEEAARRTTAIAEAHASSLAQLQQQVAELQADRRTLRDALGGMQSSLADQLQVAAGLERTQTEALIEARARQNELAAAVRRAQSVADEAGRRIAVHDEAQNAILAGLRGQVEALQADSGSWRDVSAAVQAVLARQQASAGEIDALRQQVTRMVEAQRRQQQLIEDLLLGPANSDDRMAAADSEESADLATLRRKVIALQAERLKLDAFLETRFEVLCGILDAELLTKLDEIRDSVREPDLSERRLGKRLFEALGRFAAAIAGRRKKQS